ncbi:MAG: GNAT family N-acetyltransferase, partial [Verrucomicrobiales bacterium]
QEARDELEGRAILREMVAAAPATGVLLVQDDDGAAVGLSYYNYGTGYSCGGVYLWLNCIYIRPEHQRKGYGSQMLEHIIGEGRERGMRLFLCSRHLDNEASRRLFARGGFTQEEQISMSRVFG